MKTAIKKIASTIIRLLVLALVISYLCFSFQKAFVVQPEDYPITNRSTLLLDRSHATAIADQIIERSRITWTSAERTDEVVIHRMKEKLQKCIEDELSSVMLRGDQKILSEEASKSAREAILAPVLAKCTEP